MSEETPGKLDCLEPICEEFTYNSKTYTLNEPTAAATRKFRNAASEGMSVKDGKVQGMVKDPGRLEILLLTLCIKDDSNKFVTEKEISEWPSRFVKKLHTRAFEIAGLRERDTDEQLKRALEAPESPISYESLKEYVKGLSSSDYGRLQQIFEDLEESPKN